MESQKFTTIRVEGIDQWRQNANSILLPLSVETREPESLKATIGAISIGGVRVFRITATAHSSARSERLHGHGNDPHFSVVYQVEGTSEVSQFGKTAKLRPGDFTIYDTTSPYERQFNDGTTLVMLVPQQLINLPPRAFSEINALRIDSRRGAGAIGSALLGGLAEHLESLEGNGARSLVQSTVDVVGACVAEQLGIEAPSRSNSHLDTLLEVREFIMANLGRNDLTPQLIADAHYISVRTLHQLFKEQGTTVGTWIRERRLEMARRDLIDEHNRDPIGAVGQRWGFVDATHFSNAFKMAYGSSPRGFRQAALSAQRERARRTKK